MAYRALYRVYRPVLFEDVAGQEHITSVLKNQVQTGHLSHAYLFCGPRGTGKTSTAKILSRAVNCLNPVNGEPCGNCEMCKISAQVNPDILELDGASNNGVDQARALIDQAQFAPLELRKRVFIIDEVHMLSASAFNALLKTIEEPPDHVLFILATTEPQKLLSTIVSRCQRFDFKRIGMADIVSNMQKVLDKEGVSAQNDALRAVAHAAGGGMRDALSLLNQCISVSGDQLTTTDVRNVLGSVEEDFLFSLTEKVLSGDGKGCLDAVEEIVRQGRDLAVFMSDLSSHIRSLMLTDVCGRCADLLECTEETAARYEKQSKTTTRERLLYMAEQLISARTSMRYFSNPRFLLETTLLRMASPVGETDIVALEARLTSLEKRKDDLFADRISEIESKLNLLKDSSAYASADLSRSEKETQEPLSSGTIVASEQSDPIAPWDGDDFIPEPPPEEEIYCNQDRTEIIPSEEVANSVAKPSVENGSDLLRKLQQAMKKANPMVGMLLQRLDGATVENNKIILWYTSTNASSISMLQRTNNLHQLQEEMEKIKSGLTISIQERSEADNSPELEKLRKLFGDKLTIE